MEENKRRDIKPYLLITLVYLLSQFFLLILSGCWWDDWTFMAHNLDYVAQVASESGRPEWNILVPLCWSLPNNGRILIFVLYYLDALFVYDILKNCGFFNEKDSLLITLLYLMVPVNDARLLISNFAYTVGLFLFYLGCMLFVRWNRSEKKVVYRILLLVLFFCSCILNSLLTYYYIVIFYLFLLELKKREKITIKNIFSSIWDVIRHYPDFIIVPFVYFAYNKIFFPTHGEIYSNYNTVHPLEIIKAVISIPKYILIYAYNIAILWKDCINVYTGIIIVILMALVFFFWKSDTKRKDLLYALKVVFVGAVVVILAMLAYVTLRGKMLDMIRVSGRDSVLVPLGLAFLMYAVFCLFDGKYRAMLLVPVLVLGIWEFNDLYLEWQKDTYYQLSMEHRFDNDIIRDNDTFFLADLNESLIHGQRFYSVNANAHNVFGDETRFFIPKVSNLYLLGDKEAMEFTVNALHDAYTMKDYKPEDPNLDAVLVYSCDLNGPETWKLKFDEMFNKESFRKQIESNGTLEIHVVDDDFTALLLKEYDEGKLSGDEDVLRLLEEYEH